MSGGRLLGRGLVLHAVLTQVLTALLRPTLSYRALELDVPTALLGVLAASFAVVPLVLALPSGHAVDRFGDRAVMLGGAVAMVAACGTGWLATGVVGVVAASALLGVGHLLSVVAEQARVADATGQGAFEAAFGRYAFAVSVGQALGPGLIVALGGDRTVPDTRLLLAAAAGCAVLLLLGTFAVRSLPRRGTREERASAVRDLLRAPGVVHMLVTSSVVLTTVDITVVYLPALGADRGIAAGVVGVLLAVRAAASMVSRFFLARLSAALGRRRLLLGSLALSATATAATPVPMPVWALVAVMTCLGLALGIGQPLTMAWLAEAAPVGTRGRAMSLRLTGNRLGQVVLPSALGVVAGGAGAPGVLWSTAGALAATGALARRLPAVPPE